MGLCTSVTSHARWVCTHWSHLSPGGFVHIGHISVQVGFAHISLIPCRVGCAHTSLSSGHVDLADISLHAEFSVLYVFVYMYVFAVFHCMVM